MFTSVVTEIWLTIEVHWRTWCSRAVPVENSVEDNSDKGITMLKWSVLGNSEKEIEWNERFHKNSTLRALEKLPFIGRATWVFKNIKILGGLVESIRLSYPVKRSVKSKYACLFS